MFCHKLTIGAGGVAGAKSICREASRLASITKPESA